VITTLMAQRSAGEPFLGPFRSSKRTVTRSIAEANLPSLVPTRFATYSRSASLISTSLVRRASGVGLLLERLERGITASLRELCGLRTPEISPDDRHNPTAQNLTPYVR